MNECPNCGEALLLDFDECPACGKDICKTSERDTKSRNSDLTSRIKNAEETIDKRLGTVSPLSIRDDDIEFEGRTDSLTGGGIDVSTVDLPGSGMVKLDDEISMDFLDDLFYKRFRIDIRDTLPYTHLCETYGEFAEKIVEDKELSESIKEQLKEMAKEDIKENILGMNIPGDGCYINGKLFMDIHGCADAGELMEKTEPRKDILNTTCHEKFGHGFVATWTKAGEELRKSKWRKRKLAKDFEIRDHLTPDWEIIREKYEIISKHMNYLQEGYSTWIDRSMGKELGFGRRTYDWNQLRGLPLDHFEKLKHHILERKVIDIHGRANVEEMKMIKKIGKIHEGHFTSSVGQPPEYVLGYLIFKKLEECVGAKNVPLAVKIACNIDYNLEEISISDLEKIIHKPKFNIDTRILQISRLDLGRRKNDAEALKEVAYERLNMVYGE